MYQKFSQFLENHKDIVVILINAIQPFIKRLTQYKLCYKIIIQRVIIIKISDVLINLEIKKL